MQLTYDQIMNGLNLLGVRHDSFINSNGWLNVICPFHADKSLGSAAINMKTGVFNCYSCGTSKHITKAVMEILNLTGREAYQILTGTNVSYPKKSDNSLIVVESKPKIQKIGINFNTTTFDPSKHQYTKERGFTTKWCKEFNVGVCLDDPYYMDYIIIPIIDKVTGIELFEARKLKEYEYFLKYYGRRGSLDSFRKEFKKEKVHRDTPYTRYLKAKKVLYPPNNRIKEIIFNRDNLNTAEPVYICEGMGSIPKIMSVYKNASCIFGSVASNDQIKILSEFEKVVVIPDNDDAGKKLVRKLLKELSYKVYTLCVDVEDTDSSFVQQLKERKIEPAVNFSFT